MNLLGEEQKEEENLVTHSMAKQKQKQEIIINREQPEPTPRHFTNSFNKHNRPELLGGISGEKKKSHW